MTSLSKALTSRLSKLHRLTGAEKETLKAKTLKQLGSIHENRRSMVFGKDLTKIPEETAADRLKSMFIAQQQRGGFK